MELTIMRGDITTWRYTKDDDSCTVCDLNIYQAYIHI
jgi:hypothetical protein